MVFYAIRQKSTGAFLPPGGKGLGGHTAQDPSLNDPPRLFAKQTTAEAARRAYVQGRWKESYSHSYDGEPDYSGPEPKKGTARDGSDFEVVKVTLTF